jgi:single-strand DNA-binding protein
LRVRDWQNDDRTGTTVEIEAESIGHDLFWGTASFTRTVGSADVPRDSSEPATDLVDTAVPVPAL